MPGEILPRLAWGFGCKFYCRVPLKGSFKFKVMIGVWGVGCFRSQASGFGLRIQGVGSMGFRVSGLGFRVWALRFRA